MIDLALWEPYLDAFTRMMRCQAAGFPITAQEHRADMKAYLEVSPDFWRGAALQDDVCNRPRCNVTGWYKQAPRPADARAHRRTGRRA